MVSLFKHEATSNSRAQALRAAMLAMMIRVNLTMEKGLNLAMPTHCSGLRLHWVGDG